MTLLSGFFNSVERDRLYDAEDFGNVFTGIIEDGIFKGAGTEFHVSAQGGLTLHVGEGRGFFNLRWLYNNDIEPINASESHAALDRIDAVVLRIDSSTAIRASSIEYREGTPASSPVRPTMTHTSEVNEYALAYINRAANSTTITQSNITNVVGSPETPYAVSKLLDRSFEPGLMHRNVVRGKHLGSSYTEEQKLAVRNGTFEDLYVGDYWEANGIKWRIVDIDYYLNTGIPSGSSHMSAHHLMIMPDSPLHRARPYGNRNGNNSGAYWHSLRSSMLGSVTRTPIEATFGPFEPESTSNLLRWHDEFTSAYSSGRYTATINAKVAVELPSSVMMVGSPWYSERPSGALPSREITYSRTQLSLFRLAPQFIRAEPEPGRADSTFYLRDVATSQTFAVISTGGGISYSYSDTVLGIRPIFGLK